MSESEYPFEVFIWECKDTEDINSELILKKTGRSLNTPIELIDIDSFFEIAATQQDWHSTEEKETVKMYQKLVKTLKDYLTDIRVARIGTINIDVYIVGKAPSGNLAGLATKVVET